MLLARLCFGHASGPVLSQIGQSFDKEIHAQKVMQHLQTKTSQDSFFGSKFVLLCFFKFICGQGKRRVNGRIHQLLGGSILGFFDFERKRPNFPLNEQRKSQDYASKIHQ